MIEELLDHRRVLLKNTPSSYMDLLTKYDNGEAKNYEVVFAFVYSLDDMKLTIYQAQSELEDNGVLYLCYPKLKNQLGLLGIHRDSIFPALEVNDDTGYVKDTLMRFNKMASLDKNYTLLGVKKDTKMKKRSTTSQRVDDYEEYINDLVKALKENPCYSFFVGLTKGYQKGWARYIYSAKQVETRNNRWNEMVELLNQGIKSIDLVKKGNNS